MATHFPSPASSPSSKRVALPAAVVLGAVLAATAGFASFATAADDRLVFEPVGDDAGNAPHIVLVSGDEEYRSEESMPMLGKLLSQRHGFRCTVLFALSTDGTHIDANSAAGIRGFDVLDDADLMLIATRFRRPDAESAAHITKFLRAGKPIIGLRTATHAFSGKGDFAGVPFGKFGLEILGEQWVNHHGRHKVQGARGVVNEGNADHPILRGVGEVFAVSDVYGVVHLTDRDEVLLRGAVTESLDPTSANVAGDKNDPMQPLAWIHPYQVDGGKPGKSFCTTAGAAVDLLDPDLRRMIVNAVYLLTGREVPAQADVDVVDPYTPSFYGFIREPGYWKSKDLQPSDFGLGKTVQMPDPAGTPEWNAEALSR